MATECVFCKEQIESTYFPRLEENRMFMFEILMEQTSFDKNLLIHSPMCEDCDKILLNFFNFKSNFMETEDEFINYMNADKKVDLYDVLVKTYKVKRFENENVPIKVCRICFKVTQVEEYKEIKSLESKLATMVTMCLPEVNIKLTNQIHLCLGCHSTILQYYHFLLLCIDVTKSRKTDDILQVSSSFPNKITISNDSDPLSSKTTCLEPSDPSPRKRTISEASKAFSIKDAGKDPLALDKGEPQDKRQRFEEDAWSDSSEPGSPLSLLLPVDPPKRGRGRPRKGEEVTKPGSNRKKLQKPKNKDSVRTRQDAASILRMPPEPSTPSVVKSYECQICPEILHSMKEIQEHIEGHERENRFFCWRCGYKCYNFGALCTHYDGHGMDLFKVTKHKESSVDWPGSSKNVTSSIGHKADSLLSVQRTNIYTPPELKKKRGRKRKNAVQEDTSKTPSSSTSTGIPASSSSSTTSSTSTSTNRSTLNELKVGSHKNQPSGNRKEQEVVLAASSETRRTEPTPLPSVLSCPECKRYFSQIDLYIKHSCTFKPRERNNPEESVKEQEFGCGHCCAVFFSLDDLDDHNCIISTMVVAQGGNVPLKTGEKCDVNKVPTTNRDRPGQPRPKVVSKNPEPEYECAYCLLSFDTIRGLDRHICTGDLENTQSLKISNVPVVKKETIFECSYCVSLFESSLEVNQHHCPSMPASTRTKTTPTSTDANSASIVVNSASDDSNPGSTDTMSADGVTDCLSQLLKNEPEYDCFLPPDSEIELENTVYTQEEKKVFSENTDDVSKNRNVSDQEKSIPDKAMSNEEKKRAINRIASMFGVRIVEGKERSTDQGENGKYDCMGCDFRGVDPRDLMIHVGFCDKLVRCSHCSFHTNIVQKLEIHSWLKHNILLFPCAHCAFITSMEENYLAHIKIHKEFTSDAESDNETVGWIKENSQNDVLCISDEEEGSANTGRPLDSADNSLDRSSPGPEELLNRLFDFEKVRDGGLCVSKQALRIIHRKRYALLPVSENGSLADPVTSNPNGQQTPTPNADDSQDGVHSPANQRTISAEATRPPDSDDDLADPIAFQITRSEVQTAINDTTEDRTDDNDPLSTEPVWLVKSSSIMENAMQRKIADETSALPDENDVCQSSEDQDELIIPDRIIPEPPKVKLEPSQDPLQITEETGSLQSEMSQGHCSESSKFEEICSKSEMSQESCSRPSTNVTEAAETVCIQCDSDSDSEFVESSESLLSSVAACAMEAVAISASEASKLISEGVLVINESSLVARQAESSPINVDEVASCADEVNPAEDQSHTPLQLNPVIVPTNSEDGKLCSVGENGKNFAALVDKYIGSTTDSHREDINTEDRGKETSADKDNESANDKDNGSAKEKDKKSTEDKNQESIADRVKEFSAADIDIKSANDKNKGAAEENDKGSTEYKNNESTDNKAKDCNKSNNENVRNTDSLQGEATKLLGENEESLVKCNTQTQAPNAHTSVKASDSVPKDNDSVSAKKKNKTRIIIETELEEKAADSDGSSIFVTDNEDSDVDGNEKAPTMPRTGNDNTFTKPQPTKTNENSLVSMACDEEVLISDDEDASIGNEVSKQIPAVPNVGGNNINANVLQTTKNKSPIVVTTGPSSIPTATEIEHSPKSSKNTPIYKAANLGAVNAEESFIISDDEEDAGKNEKLNTVTETDKTSLDTFAAADFASVLKQNNVEHPQKTGSAYIANLKKSAIEYVRQIGSYQGLSVENTSSALQKALKNPTVHAKTSGPSIKGNNSLKTNVPLAETAKISSGSAKNLKTYKRASGIVKNKAALGEAAKKSTAAATFSRTVSSNVGNSAQKNVLSKKTTASSTCTKAISSKGILNTSVPKKTAGNLVQTIQETTYFVIDDDDNDDGTGKVDDDKSIDPRSRSKSSLSNVTLGRGFSQDTADESAKESDSGDDCVFISVEAQSKNVRPPRKDRPAVPNFVKRPPNALHLFTSKVKQEIQLKYPHLKWVDQKNIISEAWKSMSDENKFPFQEEARLHRVLFKREHPELALTNKKVVKDPLAVKHTAVRVTDIEEIVLD